MPAEAIAVRARRVATSRPAWVAPLLLFIAASAEVLSMLLMTVFRYRAQGLEPRFFELGKTGNLLGLLLAVGFVALFLILSMLRRGRRPGLAVAAVVLSSVGLVMLSAAPLVPIDDRVALLAGYLLFKTIEAAFFLAVIGRRRRPAWRLAARTLGLTVSLLLVGGAVLIGTLLLSPVGPKIDDVADRDFDAGVILGAAVWSGDRPSPVFRERIKTGFDLLENGTIPFLVLTGANAPGELTEAEVGRRELLKLGADPTRIVIETRTRSTVQQVMFIRDELTKQGWRSFVIISDQFHLTRTLEICDFNDLDAHGVSSESPLGPQNLALYHVRESVALVLYWMFGV
ncbi:MAG TPA: YdcF family protein [Candidatus Kapabacteria bacterium]|jgi:vancomycin permeability regulator SanA|nr:YdcF family protein [Candidatus Kapabacteria bacterium]